MGDFSPSQSTRTAVIPDLICAIQHLSAMKSKSTKDLVVKFMQVVLCKVKNGFVVFGQLRHRLDSYCVNCQFDAMRPRMRDIGNSGIHQNTA